MSEPQINELIDLERYPIDSLDSPRGTRLLEQCRAELEARALCLLPNFIRPAGLSHLRSESASLSPVAHYRDEVTTFSYDPEAASKWPDGHPNRAPILGRYRQVLTGDIPENSSLRTLYMWPDLTDFIRRVYRADTMYRSYCPNLSLTLKIAHEGDTDGWHFDGNDGVVSLLLQAPDQGGEFEYAPYIRTLEDDRWDDVAAVFAEPDSHAVRPSLEPGTFVLFNGNLSMHRVRPVGVTRQPRIIALFSYDQTPDQIFPSEYADQLREFPRDADVLVDESTVSETT
jgi:hypothetical protein